MIHFDKDIKYLSEIIRNENIENNMKYEIKTEKKYKYWILMLCEIF